MCNTLPEVSDAMKKAVNAQFGSQERTRGEVRALAAQLTSQQTASAPKSGTSPS